MALIPEEDINRVREATDIVALVSEYVHLQQRGREFWGCCPFHNEKTPSFKVNPQTQLWHCFGCQQGGDVFKFLMLKEQFNYPEAIRYLANKSGITITEEEGGMPSGYRSRLLAVCEETAAFYHLQLMRGKADGCARARQYLGGRGFGGEVPKKWNLGYAPGRGSLVAHLRSKGFKNQEMIDANVALSSDRGGLRDRFYERVMFPIRDLQGRTIAFGGRVIGQGEPKYINTSNCPLFSKRSNLFGIDAAKSTIVTRGAAVVVEGYTDVISMHEHGFTNAVATLGTALTPQHVKLLTRFADKVIYLFDGDAAGQKAADRAAELITTSVAPESGSRPVSLSVAVIPGNMDPVEFIDAQGRDAMQALLDGAEPLLRFVIDRRIAQNDLSTPEQRAIALPRVLEPLIPIRGSILADEYLNYVSDVFRIDLNRVRETFRKLRPPRVYNADEDDSSVPLSAYGEPYAGEDDPYDPGPPAVPAFAVPREGTARWEAELLNVYALHPQMRTLIATSMEGEEWSLPLYRDVMAALRAEDSAAKPSALVMSCMAAHPESEALWNMHVPLDEDAERAEATVKVMLTERAKSAIGDEIRKLEHRVKYDNTLGNEELGELFGQISALQKRLSELRR